MKKIKIALLAFASAVVFTACDDATSIKQPSELLPEDTFESIADLRLGLNAVYGAVPGENSIYFTSVFTDEIALGVANGGQGRGGELAFLLNANSGDASSIWVSNYLAINLANRLIAGAGNVPVEAGSADETTKNDIVAQARALRAFAHFQLLTYFSTDLKDPSALGVIALDYVPDPIEKLPRNTNAECFALIESDLAFADTNLIPAVSIGERTKVNTYFLAAFRARMAAYRGNYELAKTYVDQLDAVFGLTSKSTYRNIFLDVPGNPAVNSAVGVDTAPWAGNESIFQLERANQGPGTGNFSGYWSNLSSSTATGSHFFEVNRALFNLVNNTLDARRLVIADQTSIIMDNYNDPSVSYTEYINNDILPVGKYSYTESLDLLGDIKVFRFSEMALIRAEYYTSVNDLVNATAQINNIRRARYNNTNGSATTGNIAQPSTAQGMWAAILDERRAELSFEGHRYIDIKRLGQLAGKGVERDARDCSFNDFCTLPASDGRFTLPIPQNELTANPNIQQNPGY